MNSKNLNAALVLSDGSYFFGSGFGAEGESCGELVFNTSMMGYQEALSDPSYAGQILLMCYPLIGNYGVNETYFESKKIHVRGFCVFEASERYEHYTAKKSISEFLEEFGIPGIQGIDTRHIVKKIRDGGVMPAALGVYSGKPDLDKLLSLARSVDYSKTDFVKEVTTKEPYVIEPSSKSFDRRPPTVVLIDCGVKAGIIRQLKERDVRVVVVPAFSSEREIRSFEPDGIVVSNGPGDPALLKDITKVMRKLFDLPIFGICLGHQLLGQAAGARTYKLKFGHRGANHPVLDKKTKKVAITSQNHGYAVDANEVSDEFEETHINLNDGTNEGLMHKSLPIFSVQYHPEASPGPQDSKHLFDVFVKYLKEE
ncbi:MAG: glutamine-hydrolyzing carbamoyl-phosphate synthase small subunit [Candidatus Anstonellales archaeon]